MAILSGVAYKDPEDANKTFEKYGFNNHRFIEKDGAQCYVIWNDTDAIIAFRGTEPKEMSDVKADLVIPVPDSGVPAALGFAQLTKKNFELGLIRNHYVGRTFIEPAQNIRGFGVKLKL